MTVNFIELLFWAAVMTGACVLLLMFHKPTDHDDKL